MDFRYEIGDEVYYGTTSLKGKIVSRKFDKGWQKNWYTIKMDLPERKPKMIAGKLRRFMEYRLWGASEGFITLASEIDKGDSR